MPAESQQNVKFLTKKFTFHMTFDFPRSAGIFGIPEGLLDTRAGVRVVCKCFASLDYRTGWMVVNEMCYPCLTMKWIETRKRIDLRK